MMKVEDVGEEEEKEEEEEEEEGRGGGEVWRERETGGKRSFCSVGS